MISEEYSVSKKIIVQDFVIEKRWVTGTATVSVPVTYEEIYVNGKKFGSSIESMLSSVKGAIKKETDDERISRKKSSLKGTQVPLFEGSSETEKVLPLFGEEILIRKRMRQVGEVAITKRRVTQNRKMSIQTNGEKIMIKHPDGSEESSNRTLTSATG